MKKQDLQVSMTIDHDFPRKVSHCYTIIFIPLRYDQVIMGKDAKGKGKGKSHAKRVKDGKCSAEEQDVKESRDSLLKKYTHCWNEFPWVGFVISYEIWKLRFEAINDNERKPRFNLMYNKFRFDGDFFVRNLDASVEWSTKRGNFSLVRDVNKNMQMKWNTSD